MKKLMAGVLLFSACVFAQTTANIVGTVSDSSGAVIPNVKVTVTNTGTGLTRTTTSSNTGVYSLPSLPVGEYSFRAEISGFKKKVVTGIHLEVRAGQRGDIALEV